MEEVPSPISKLLFEEAEPRMTALREYIARQSWSTEYEVVPSNPYLLELTAKGANKGGMVRRLAQMLEIRQENVYCVGDHANDIPMLTFARTAFAPANAIEPVHKVPGHPHSAQLLGERHCGHDRRAGQAVLRRETVMCESEPLTLYVVYTAKSGCREAFVRQIVMEGIADTIRREEGCIRYDYYFSAQQEDKILLVEQWQTQAHQRIHLQQPHMARLRELKEQYVADTRLGRVTLEEA